MAGPGHADQQRKLLAGWLRFDVQLLQRRARRPTLVRSSLDRFQDRDVPLPDGSLSLGERARVRVRGMRLDANVRSTVRQPRSLTRPTATLSRREREDYLRRFADFHPNPMPPPVPRPDELDPQSAA